MRHNLRTVADFYIRPYNGIRTDFYAFSDISSRVDNSCRMNKVGRFSFFFVGHECHSSISFAPKDGAVRLNFLYNPVLRIFYNRKYSRLRLRILSITGFSVLFVDFQLFLFFLTGHESKKIFPFSTNRIAYATLCRNLSHTTFNFDNIGPHNNLVTRSNGVTKTQLINTRKEGY